MKQENDKRPEEAAGQNPKNRDFQRTDEETDQVSQSQKDQGNTDYGLSETHPKNRDFQGSDEDDE